MLFYVLKFWTVESLSDSFASGAKVNEARKRNRNLCYDLKQIEKESLFYNFEIECKKESKNQKTRIRKKHIFHHLKQLEKENSNMILKFNAEGGESESEKKEQERDIFFTIY